MSDGKLKLSMERGRLVMELPSNVLELFVNGELAASYFLGVTDGPAELQAKLAQANAAHAACRMLRSAVEPMKLPSDKRASDAWVNGFRQGLAGNHVVLGDVHAPPRAVTNAAGMEAWELGYAIRAALALADGKPDPRRVS